MKRSFWLMLLLAGCAGTQRDCQSCNASNFGADWVVVQYAANGRPINCWQLRNTGISNEIQSDGIFWSDGETGHLVHISGWYDRVQVAGGRFGQAAASVGVKLNQCTGGAYVDSAEERP